MNFLSVQPRDYGGGGEHGLGRSTGWGNGAGWMIVSEALQVATWQSSGYSCSRGSSKPTFWLPVVPEELQCNLSRVVGRGGFPYTGRAWSSGFRCTSLIGIAPAGREQTGKGSRRKGKAEY